MLFTLSRGELIPARDETRDEPALLAGRRLGGRLDAHGLRAGNRRSPSRIGEAVPRMLHPGGDLLVLPPDATQQVEVVDEVGERRGAEHERERVGPVGHVQVAHAAFETPQGDVVLAAQPRQPCGLRGDRPFERGETRA